MDIRIKWIDGDRGSAAVQLARPWWQVVDALSIRDTCIDQSEQGAGVWKAPVTTVSWHRGGIRVAVRILRKGLKNYKDPGAVAFVADNSSRGRGCPLRSVRVPCEPSSTPRQVFGSPISVRYPVRVWGLGFEA